MKISVIVPTYRRPQCLKRCVKALDDQTRKPNEVIVVVRDTDAVSQKMVAHLRGALRKSLNIKVISVHKSGQLPALNAGLNEARGHIICFTDDDTEPWSDWIKRIEKHFRNSTIAGIGGRDIVIINGKSTEGKCKVVGKMFWFGRYIGNHHLELLQNGPRRVDLLKGANMAFLSKYLEGFCFDENLDKQTSSNNEIDLCLYIKKKGGRIVYDSLLKVNHYAIQRFAGAKREEMAKNIYNYSHNYTYVILKNFPLYRRLAFLVYIFLVGQRSSLGVLTAILDSLVRRKIAWREQIIPSFKGKVDGIRTYLKYRNQEQITHILGPI